MEPLNLHGAVSNGFDPAVKVSRLALDDLDVLDAGDELWRLGLQAVFNHLFPPPAVLLQTLDRLSSRPETLWQLRISDDVLVAMV
jgi:hypothetical protein